MNNIFIISARRSGTHLLTDLIVNNFNYERIDNSIDYDFLTNDNVDEFICEMSKGNKLAWSHYHDYDNFFDKNLDDVYIDELKTIFKSSKIIYIYRDVRDTMTSYYHRPNIISKYKSFNDFYHIEMRDYTQINNYRGDDKNLFDVICNQHLNWLSLFFGKELINLDLNIITYEEIIIDYNLALNKIGQYLNMNINKINDVRLTSTNNRNVNIKYTDNDFRNGSVGDWVNTMDIEFGEKLQKIYDEKIKYHLNAYIFNPKLHEFHEPEQSKFQINSRDWKSIEKNTDIELIKFNDKFNSFLTVLNVNELIENRYQLCERKYDDIRYKHKVFYYNEYVLKFIYPCKALLNKNTFDYVVPIASKVNLLTILKTNDILYRLNIIPKLYYAGIYNGILFVIQEKFNANEFLNVKFNINSNSNWDWIIDNNLFPMIIEQFITAINYNILLTDYISPYNTVIHENKLKYVDLDGIYYFNDRSELLNSNQYKSIFNTFKTIDKLWKIKFGYSLLNEN